MFPGVVDLAIMPGIDYIRNGENFSIWHREKNRDNTINSYNINIYQMHLREKIKIYEVQRL